jgi:adenosylhomocysteine nucleosidase
LRHLGIVVATAVEARSLVRKTFATNELVRLPEGTVIQLSGIGPRRAGGAAKNLLEHGATALLSWGSAGGLAPKLFPGSLILPKTVIASDQSRYHVEASWHQRLGNRLKGHVDFHTEPLVESTSVVRTPAEKAVLFLRTGAIGVDMESAAVATVAQEAQVPFMVVRAVADSTDTTIPKSSLKAVDEFGRLSCFKLIQGLVEYPGEFFALVRIARNYRAAQRTLAVVARLTGYNLLVP